MTKILLMLIIILATRLSAQDHYPIAPEKWSKPQIVKGIPDYWNGGVVSSISSDGKWLFFDGACYLEKTDTGWSQMKKLNSNINQHLVDHAFISPNGKRLFFRWYLGGYQMYYSDWDSAINDWGVAKNCGPNINNAEGGGAISGGTMPDDTTLLFLASNLVQISHWNKATQSWTRAHRFPGYPDEYNYFASDWSSLHATPGLKKVYLMASRSDKDKDGNYYLNNDIVVEYKTSTEHDIYSSWPHTLHFCLESDTLYWNGTYSDRFEGNPVLTPDGKTMYFLLITMVKETFTKLI